jgi:saccharopepsin
MGIRPDRHQEMMFQDTSIKPQAGHDVLVDNFLNAQCKLITRIISRTISDR